jgi:hypothetical protein
MNEQLVAEYNKLVAEATGLGLTGYRAVVRFTDRESGEKQIAALKSSMRARSEGQTQDKEQEVKKAVKSKVTKKKAKSTNGNGSKTAEVGRLLKRKSGCTTAEILAATGWQAVSVPLMAKACGLALHKEKNKGKVTRYWGE